MNAGAGSGSARRTRSNGGPLTADALGAGLLGAGGAGSRAASSRNLRRTQTEAFFARRVLFEEFEEKLDLMWSEFKHFAINGTVTRDEAVEIVGNCFSGVQDSWWADLRYDEEGTLAFDELVRIAQRVVEETEGVRIGVSGNGGIVLGGPAAGQTGMVGGSGSAGLFDDEVLAAKVVKLGPIDYALHTFRSLCGLESTAPDSKRGGAGEFGDDFDGGSGSDADGVRETTSTSGSASFGDSGSVRNEDTGGARARGSATAKSRGASRGSDLAGSTSDTAAARRAAAAMAAARGMQRQRVEYELDCGCSWRPRELLLSISALLMFVICAVNVVIVTMLWIRATESLEMDRVEKFGFAFASVASSFEEQFLARHGEGMEEMANDIGNRVEAMQRLDRATATAEVALGALASDVILQRLQKRRMTRHDHVLEQRVGALQRWAFAHSGSPKNSSGPGPVANVTTVRASTGINARAALEDSQTVLIEQLVGSSILRASDVRRAVVGTATITLGVPTSSFMNNAALGEIVPRALGYRPFVEAAALAMSGIAAANDRAGVPPEFHDWLLIVSGRTSIAAAPPQSSPTPMLSFPTYQQEMLQCDTPRFQDAEWCPTWNVLDDVTAAEWPPQCNSRIFSLALSGPIATVACRTSNISLATNSSSAPAANFTITGSGSELAPHEYFASLAPMNGLGVPIHHVTAFRDADNFVLRSRQNLIRLVEHLNFAFVRSTELVVGGRNASTGVPVAQFTSFRFSDGCYEQCSRFSPSTRNFVAALNYGGSGWSITPDYRPEPIVGAYRWIGGDLAVVFYIERDVIEIRRTGLTFLTKIADAVNSGLSGSSELEFVENRGNPRMRYFASQDPCPARTDCVALQTNPAFIFFQYGCQHCQRVNRDAIGEEILRLTQPKKATAGFDLDAAAQLRQQYALALAGTSLALDGFDYASESVLLFTARIDNYTVGLVFKVDRHEFLGPILRQVGVATAVNLAFIFVGVLIVLFSSSSALSNVEREWQDKERSIENGRRRFEQLSKAVIPSQVHSRLLRGVSFIAETIPATAFLVVNACKFSELIRHYNHRHVVRLSGYIDFVLSVVADKCSLTKLRMVGDAFWVMGTRDEIEEDAHPTRRVMRFAVAVIDLFSSTYRHHPQSSPELRTTFADFHKSSSSLIVPSMRCGAHFGSAVMGAVTQRETSMTRFDCYGTALSLTHRMCAQSEPHRIMVSAAFKDALTAHDTKRLFTFDAPRKMNVRVAGTSSTSMFLVRSSRLPLMRDVMQRCGIEPALRPFPLDPDVLRQQGLLGGGSSKHGGSHSSSNPSESSRSNISSRSWFHAGTAAPHGGALGLASGGASTPSQHSASERSSMA